MEAFHEMQSNFNVMQFLDSEIKTFGEDSLELEDLIKKHNTPNNDFWVHAIEKKI